MGDRIGKRMRRSEVDITRWSAYVERREEHTTLEYEVGPMAGFSEPAQEAFKSVKLQQLIGSPVRAASELA